MCKFYVDIIMYAALNMICILKACFWLLILMGVSEGQFFTFPAINEMHRCQISPDVCPNPNVSFFLYSRYIYLTTIEICI